jgi:release factor glutamine methyltransferase
MFTDAETDYVRGYVPFLGQNIFLDSRPLIPRTETEYWVEQALSEIPKDQMPKILDLFAGSGCIGIAILAHIKGAHVTFAEKEPRHLPTIKRSLEENSIDPEHASLIESDVWSAVPQKFDYIFANPPYISKERSTVETSVTRSEPEEALFAENDGFYFIEKIIVGLSEHLMPKGTCYIEHEPFHTERVSEVAERYGFKAETFKDQYGALRYSRLTHALADMA